MKLACGCTARWLTEASQPVSMVRALEAPCPCCGAAKAKRCAGGAGGFLTGNAPRNFAGAYRPGRCAYVDVCPSRLIADLRAAGGVTMRGRGGRA